MSELHEADRLYRKELMVACDAVRCLISILFALGYAEG